ncbi:MAG: amidohydrolase family protein, partial [Synergistetes bacterium]|nr:amidohydrolase family protein [Synergistota bacterium]
EKVASELRKHPNITADMGQVLFEDTTTMTADTPWQYHLHTLTNNRWVSTDVEVEAGAGIVPYKYKKNSVVNAVQWAAGLELALMLDPWQIFLTTDSPNGGPFFMYPEVVKWLTSEDARRDVIKTLPSSFRKRTFLEGIHRELSLSEIIIMMSAGPAKALGFANKGHLGAGADADIAIYKKRSSVADTMGSVYMLFKNGELVVDKGKIVSGERLGRFIRVDTGVEDKMLDDKVMKMFSEYYSVNFSNYVVEDVYFKNEEVIRCE